MSLTLSVPLIDLACPACSHVQRAKVSDKPWLTGCVKCEALLVVEPIVYEKTNKVMFEFVPTAVPRRKEIEGRKLKVA